MADADTEQRLKSIEVANARLAARGRGPIRDAIGGGDPLPKGTGKYKVLMLIDDLDPATPDWDFPRFPSTV